MVRIGDEGAIVASALNIVESKSLTALDIEIQILQVDTPLSTFISNRYKVFEVDFCMTIF